MPKYSFTAIGTNWEIESTALLTPTLRDKIAETIEGFDKAFSRFRTDSLIRKMADKAGTYQFPSNSLRLFQLYDDLFDTTDGFVTPTIGSSLENLGYDQNYSLAQTQVSTSAPNYRSSVQRTGTTLSCLEPVLLDYGAAGKGYLVDLLAELLQTNGVTEYIIDASGDIRHRGQSTHRIGLENPNDPTMAIGILNLKDASLCASATNRRSWGDNLHHVLNPFSGQPTRAIQATWVVARDTMTADGLATAVFFCDPKKLQNQFNFTYVRMFASGEVDYSVPVDGELYV